MNSTNSRIQDLRAFNDQPPGRGSQTIDDLMALSADARELSKEYGRRNVPRPEWLDNATRHISQALEVQTRQQALDREEAALSGTGNRSGSGVASGSGTSGSRNTSQK